MHRALCLAVAMAMASSAGCLPTVAGSLVVSGGVSLYGAKRVHGDCGNKPGNNIPCFWTDMLFTWPLTVLGAGLIGGGIAVGVYAATHDEE